jgi:hypothetical protein
MQEHPVLVCLSCVAVGWVRVLFQGSVRGLALCAGPYHCQVGPMYAATSWAYG